MLLLYQIFTRYAQCKGKASSRSSLNIVLVSWTVDSHASSGRAGQVCRPDAVSFPQASATGAGSSSQRFCGSKLSAVDGTALGHQQIITYQTPFRLFSELSYPMEYVHQIMS